MITFRRLLGAGAAVVLAWLAWNGYVALRELASDRAAATAIKSYLSEGQRLVPVRRSKELRGDEKSDYWCFTDGFCFYPMARFRVLYFAYNDLEDDVLLAELRAKGAPRRRRSSRARSKISRRGRTPN